MMIDDDDDMEVDGEETDDEQNGDAEKDEKDGKPEDDGKEGEKPKRYKAPTEAEYKETLAKLDRAERKAARREQLLREAQKQNAKGSKDEKDGKDEKDEKPSGPSARERALETTAIRSAGRAAFRDAGFEGTGDAAKDRQALSRLVQLIDTSELRLDEKTGEVEGLDDQVAEIKDQFPGLFKQSEGRRRREPAPRVNRGGGSPGSQKPPTSDEILVRRLTGQGR